MTKKKYPRYLTAAIVAVMLNIITFAFSFTSLIQWQYILIISVLYFIWEAFLEKIVTGGD